MKWTTIQKDGVIRTLDTNKDGLFDIFLEIIATKGEKIAKKKESKKERVKKTANWGKFFVWAIILILFMIIVNQVGALA